MSEVKYKDKSTLMENLKGEKKILSSDEYPVLIIKDIESLQVLNRIKELFKIQKNLSSKPNIIRDGEFEFKATLIITSKSYQPTNIGVGDVTFESVTFLEKNYIQTELVERKGEKTKIKLERLFDPKLLNDKIAPDDEEVKYIKTEDIFTIDDDKNIKDILDEDLFSDMEISLPDYELEDNTFPNETEDVSIFWESEVQG